MTVHGTRTDTLLDEYQTACMALRATIESVPDDKWQIPTPGDGRQVNVVAHHAAASHRPIVDQIQAMANGENAAISMDDIHAGNAQHARQMGACSKAETLQAHDEGQAYATAFLRGLNEDQLSRPGEFLIGRPATVEQAIQAVLIGHPREHAATIQSALG